MRPHPELSSSYRLMAAGAGVSFLQGFGLCEAAHVQVDGPCPCSHPAALSRCCGRKRKERRKQGGERVGHKEKLEVSKWMVVWTVKFSM